VRQYVAASQTKLAVVLHGTLDNLTGCNFTPWLRATVEFPDLQAPQALDSSVHAVLQTPWTAWGALLTCSLLPGQEEACQLVAKMTHPQLAVIRQVGLTAVHSDKVCGRSFTIAPVAFVGKDRWSRVKFAVQASCSACHTVIAVP